MLGNKKIALILNGEFPKLKKIVTRLVKYDTIITCDGAYAKAINIGIKPHYTIGDFDSIDEKEIISGQTILIDDQSENDMRKAINWIAENKGESIDIYGGGGMRDDHFLANILSLLEHTSNIKKRFYTNYGIFSTQTKKMKYESFKGQQISIFSSDKSIVISATGLLYKIDNLKCEPGYILTLNESIGSAFTVKNSHGVILVYQAFKSL